MKRVPLKHDQRNRMQIVFLSILIAAAVGIVYPHASVFAGDIHGMVVLPTAGGSFRPISPFARSRGSNSGAKTTNTVVVYLEESPNLTRGVPPAVAPVMDQRNYTIVPHLLTVVAGTTVRFPNSDDVFHNLFSLSTAKKFDLGRYPNGTSKEVRFDKPGDVRIYCDIHPTMSGVILIVPNKFHTTAGETGEFSLRDVPAGSYTISAWHEQYPKAGSGVKVLESGVSEVELRFTLP